MMSDHQEDKKQNALATKKAWIVFVVGAIAFSILFYFFKKPNIDSALAPLTQDSFQGPAEMSAAVQINCQESAKKVVAEQSCADKESEFLKNIDNCLSVFYSIEADKNTTATEGNYGDLALQISKCYSVSEKSNAKASEWLKKINEKYDWDIYMGPITCDSKSTLAANIEKYSETHEFKCFKVSELPNIISEIKSKKFQILKSMLSTDEISHQGLIEADVSCPETFVNIEKNLNKILSSGFEVAEPKIEDGSDDIHIEITKNKNRLVNLQFKVKAEGCLHFESLLAPSTESE